MQMRYVLSRTKFQCHSYVMFILPFSHVIHYSTLFWCTPCQSFWCTPCQRSQALSTRSSLVCTVVGNKQRVATVCRHCCFKKILATNRLRKKRMHPNCDRFRKKIEQAGHSCCLRFSIMLFAVPLQTVAATPCLLFFCPVLQLIIIYSKTTPLWR
jgi:hypothetical protein